MGLRDKASKIDFASLGLQTRLHIIQGFDLASAHPHSDPFWAIFGESPDFVSSTDLSIFFFQLTFYRLLITTLVCTHLILLTD